MEHFDGAWTVSYVSALYSLDRHSYLCIIAIAGLMYDISFKVCDTGSRITSHRLSSITMSKTVSLWCLQMTASAVRAALRSVVNPVSVQVRGLYLDGASVLDVGAADALSAPVGA
jgi:hypothetical protein